MALDQGCGRRSAPLTQTTPAQDGLSQRRVTLTCAHSPGDQVSIIQQWIPHTAEIFLAPWPAHNGTAALRPLNECNNGVLRGGLATTAPVPPLPVDNRFRNQASRRGARTAEGSMVPHDAESRATHPPHSTPCLPLKTLHLPCWEMRCLHILMVQPTAGCRHRIAGKGNPIAPTYHQALRPPD